MNKVSALALCAILFAGSSCTMVGTLGSGNVVTEERSVSSFDSVNLCGVGTIYVVSDTNAPAVRVEAEDNLLKLIDTEVDNGVLTVDEHNIIPTRDLKFYVNSASLSSLTISGSGDIRTVETITNASLKIVIMGSGSVTCDARVKNFEGNINGSGSINLTGSASYQKLLISGSGSINAGAFRCDDGNITISGSGGVSSWISNSAEVLISGSGSVTLNTSPATLKQTILGSGGVSITSSK